MVKIAPSVLSADFSILTEQLRQIEQGGADWIHIDIMDGQFVPNMTFGPKIIETIKKLSRLPLDVHLMVREPDHLIPDFISAGADFLTVHVEAIQHIHRTLNLIRSHGARPGVTLNPGTPSCSLDAIYEEVDLILVMTVNPGFAAQKFIPGMLSKIRQIADKIKLYSTEIYLEVDGGIDETTAPLTVQSGANVLVAGNAIFKKENISMAISRIRDAVL